jgi:lipopolysaccharide export system protein LptC
MDMLKKLILIVAVGAVCLSGYLLYHDKRHQEVAPKDELPSLEIPVTTTQVTPGLEAK